MVESTEIKMLVDAAIKSAQALYDRWYSHQATIWPNFHESYTTKCYNNHSSAVIFQGTGRECSLLFKAIDEELFKRGIHPWCSYLDIDPIDRIKPNFVSSDTYIIWVNYAGKGHWTYGIDKFNYFVT